MLLLYNIQSNLRVSSEMKEQVAHLILFVIVHTVSKWI